MTVVAPNMSPAAAASVVAEVLAGSSRALRRTVQRPPVLLVVVVQLLAVVGDVYGQRATRHNFKSARRMLIASTVVSALMVTLVLGGAQLLMPDTTSLLTQGDISSPCFQEVDMEGLSPRTCANPSRACTRIPCPSQGPFSMLRSLQLHPLLWMNGLLAIVYQLVDIVLYHHPLAIVLKPLAGLVATFFVAPVQYFLGYRDEFFPHYITALGLIGAALVVFENRHYVAIRSSLLPSLDTTTTTTTSASDTPNPRGASMRSAISFGAAVPPLSKANDSKGEEGGEDSNKDDKGRKGVPAGEKTQLLGNINSRDVETGARQEKSVGKAVAAAGVASALVPTLILSLSTAVWIIVQKYANDEYHVNAFGYTSLDQVLSPFYIGLFLLITDGMASARAFLLQPADQHESFAQACGESWRLTFAEGGSALWNLCVFRFLANVRVVAYFWMSVTYNLNALFFELTILRMCMSWGFYAAMALCLPHVIDMTQAERDKAFEGIAQKALGTGLVIAALTLLHYV